MCLLILSGWLVCPPLAADDFARGDQFFAQLAAPMNSIVDGKSFRDGIGDIARQAELNWWLDRQVDPTAPIEVGPVGPTVFAAIQKLAAARGCSVMPVAGVLLVGRPDWVQQTTASLLRLSTARPSSTGDVRWGDLTTPTEALNRSAGMGQRVTVEPTLPHDLWPATHWRRIDHRVALTLVLAQFDLKPVSTTSLQRIEAVQAGAGGRFTRRYAAGDGAGEIRRAMARVDATSRVRAGDNWLIANGSVVAHQAATLAMLAAADVKPPDPDQDTFTLKRMSTTAANALMQLAQTAGKSCRIEAPARDACNKIISIEGKDASLRELISRVAEQAGVDAHWNGDTITIRLKNE